MGRDEKHWSFRTSADPGCEFRVRTFAHIRIPANADSKHLEDLAAQHDLEIRSPVAARGRARETCLGARVSAQTVAGEGVIAHLADAAETHVRRKQLLARTSCAAVVFRPRPSDTFWSQSADTPCTAAFAICGF